MIDILLLAFHLLNKILHMKLKTIIILLVIIIGIIYFSINIFGTRENHYARDGILYFSNQELSAGEIFKLKGEWKSGEDNIIMPDVWTGDNVYGTKVYNLKLVSDYPFGEIGFKIPEMFSAFEFYADSILLYDNGRVGNNKDEVIEEWRPGIISYKTHKKEIFLSLKISNYSYVSGGIWQDIFFGNFESIRKFRTHIITIEFFIIGSLITMFLYHLGLYFMRPKEKSSLFFGFTCFVISIRILVSGEIYLSSLFDIEWNNLVNLNFGTIALSIPLFLLYIDYIYKKIMKRIIVDIVVALSIIFLLITAFFHPSISSRVLLPWYHMVILFSIAYISFTLFIAYKRNLDSSASSLTAFIILGIAVFNDILSVNNIISMPQLTPYGLFLYLSAQSFIISRRFHRDYRKVLVLSKSLEEKNSELSIKKDEITAAYKKLSSSYNKIAQQEKLASLGTLMTGITHEINNPVQSIKFYIESVEMDIDDLIEILKKLSEMKDKDENPSIESIIDLIDNYDIEIIIEELQKFVKDNLKSIKRIENIISSTKKMAHKNEDLELVNIEDVITDAITLTYGNIKRDVKIYTKFNSDKKVFYGSAQLIGQVLINLVTNAVDAINSINKKDGFVEIETLTDGDGNIYLKVRDNGEGIPEDVISKIFDPFFTTKKIGKGTGMGLYISYNIINEHGGKMWVENFEEGGTMFHIILPTAGGSHKNE